MSAQDHLNEQQFGYHVSPWNMKVGSLITPGGKPSNFDNDRSGKYTFMTPSEDKAMEYHYLLTEQGIKEPYSYAVEPTGPVEEDPADPESVRSTSPLRIIDRDRNLRPRGGYHPPPGS